jgi:hypothetical protein
MCEKPPPPCVAFSESEAVFVGTVKNVIQDNETEPIPKVEIEVEQNFRGMKSKTAFTYNYSHSCAWTFEKGEKFLFYGSLAEKDENYFSTHFCTRTQEFDEKLIDFEFLNSLNNPTPNYWIWGTITKISDTSYLGHQPLQGVKAQVFDNKNKLVGMSDVNGNLKISVSKEGLYKIRVFPPKGTSLDSDKFINSAFFEKRKTLKNYNFDKMKPFVEYEVEVKANKCGWFYLPLQKYEKE